MEKAGGSERAAERRERRRHETPRVVSWTGASRVVVGESSTTDSVATASNGRRRAERVTLGATPVRSPTRDENDTAGRSR